MIEHALDIGEAMTQPGQIKDRPRVKAAAARRHHQPVEHADAHGTGDALPPLDGAETGPCPQMRNDRAPRGEHGRRLAQ